MPKASRQTKSTLGNTTITLEIPTEFIIDLLEGHGGSYSPWLKSVSGKYSEWYEVVFDRECDDEGTFKGKRYIYKSDIQAGLALLALNSPMQFGPFLCGDADDLTFDSAWQYIIFGKLVYG